ncbi:flagellar biosynthesis protein FlhF [Achromobacter sp. F4_2707]|uniref:flagellar biosynthesis protein FlhF n=1 Tax=Achromobacter sp. F4_2707 TaxID=3114286 RepID=UPI0039C5F4D3
MRQVRLALGPDALIVSNRRVEGGVEILATDASELPDAAADNTAPSTAPASSPLQAPSGDLQRQAPQTNAAPTQAPAQAPTPPPPGPSPMSPLGAYAAAFQAAYGVAPEPAPTPSMPPAPQPPSNQPGMDAFSAEQAPGVPLNPGQISGYSALAESATRRPLAAEPLAQQAPSAQQPWPELAQQHPATSSGPAAPEAQPQPDIMDAIGDMRGALENRIDELLWGNQLRRAPQAASLFQELMGFGFSTALLRAMLKRLPEQLSSRAALQWVREELIGNLPVLSSEDDLWKPGLVLALVGPTGVGKTTTIAKLAARCVRRFGPDKLVLITTDTYRIGAHEQLKIYGQMLRAPVHVVRNAMELQEVMTGVRPDQIILIDNVGISQRDRYIHEQAAMLAAAGRDVTRLLVLNAASHGETLDEVARSYAADGGTPLKGCIITKVDEAIRLGAALDTALRYRLPIHYVSIGQKVPEHLAFLSATELVDRALTHLPSARTLYAPTEADFAALMQLTRSTGPAADTAAQEDARRQRMLALPRLLSMTAGGAAHLSADDLRAGCEYIDELSCVSEAYDLWRSLVSSNNQGSAPDSWVQHMLRLVQNTWSESGQKHLLAVHDQVALRASGAPTAQLRATLMLDEQGAALASTLQQLSLPEGWLSSCGAAQTDAPPARLALQRQFDWQADHAADLPVVHLFEGGNPALWRELSGRSQPWLAQVPAITRIYMEDGSTTVQALAKNMPHQPVADPGYLFTLAELGNAPASECALWAASATVHIASRGHEPLPLQMVSALLVDRTTGKRLKQVIGLHPGLDFSIEKLATWLVIKAESRDAMRHAASAWGLLESRDGQPEPRHKALVAAQLGLAAWQLQKSPLAQQGRELAATMLGRKRLLPSAAATATLKLFALKEMLEA